MTRFAGISENEVRELMLAAYKVALDSPDPSTQNGALLYHIPTAEIVATACNTFPEGVEQTDERWTDRSWKYPLVDHAEANVMLTAFRDGVFHDYSIIDMVMVCPWAACSSCAGVIIGMGLPHLITHQVGIDNSHGPWIDDVNKARIMFAEAKRSVTFELYDGLVGDITVRRDGKAFNPDKFYAETRTASQ